MAKTIEQKYQVLSDIDHVLKRPGRYVGAITKHTSEGYYIKDGKVVYGEISYNPAFLKIFDEIISNSVDFSKTPEGKHVNQVVVEIDPMTGEISVFDNGGIPVVMHKEAGCYVPEMIFGRLRAGSNFDDDTDSFATGQNGEGAVLCNILSSSFEVLTADGKNQFQQLYQNNMREVGEPEIRSTGKHRKFTRIRYTPDYSFFATNIHDEMPKLVKRVYDLAACNPHLKITLNGEQIKLEGFEAYVKMYTKDYVYESNNDWRVAVAASDRGFVHTSFVNSTETSTGGNHVNYVLSQITTGLRAWIKKKKKVDVKPAEIKNHLHLFIDCAIVNPRYSSQTKEDMITEVRDFKTEFTVTEKMIEKIAKSPVVEKIMDWVEAKARQEELAEMRKMNKSVTTGTLKSIVKFDDASERVNRHECAIFFSEGDSAAKPMTAGRDPKKMGVFPLRGKPINVRGVGAAKLKKNEEFQNIMAILGLQIGKKASPYSMRFGKIVIGADADHDGNHILGLMLNLFNEFWPELLKQGVIYYLNTPIIKVWQGNKVLEFFSQEEFREWEAKNTKPFRSKYFKGLGGHTTEDFRKYMGDEKYYVQLKASDEEDYQSLDLAFDKTMADKRKEWLSGEEQ